MLQKLEKIRTGWLAENVIAWQPVLLSLLVFLALARWLTGGTFLGLESGFKGVAETGLLLLAFVLMLKWWGKDALTGGWKLPTFVVLVVFVIWAAITLLWSPTLLRAGVRLLNMVIIILLAGGIATQKQFLIKMLAWSVLAGLTIFLMLMLLANIPIYGTPLPITVGVDRLYISLVFEHYNNAVTFYAVGFLLSLHCFLNFESKNYRTLPGLLLVFYGALLVFSASRSGLAGVLFAVSLYCIWHFKSFRLAKWLQWVFLLLGALIILLFLSGIWQTWAQMVYQQYPGIFSLNSRNRIWSVVLINFLDAPFGVSFFGGRPFFAQFSSYPLYFHWVDHAHNLFFDILLTTGIPGVLILIGFLWTLLPILRHAWSMPLAASLMIYTLIHSATEAKIFVPSILMFVFCLFVFANQYHTDRLPS